METVIFWLTLLTSMTILAARANDGVSVNIANAKASTKRRLMVFSPIQYSHESRDIRASVEIYNTSMSCSRVYLRTRSPV